MRKRSIDTELKGRKLLLVASTGGHLAQLALFAKRWTPAEESSWITFKSAQSESLLIDSRVDWVPYVRPRDWKGMIRVAFATFKVLRREKYDAVVSTGAGIATGALLVARLLGRESYYVESVSRTRGPSLSGKLVQRIPGVRLGTQHRSWSGGRWQEIDSIFGAYAASARPVVAEVMNIFVTLGTIEGYRFDSLIDRLISVAPPEARFVWQIGHTDRTDLPGRVEAMLTHEEFRREALGASVVVTHAGVGSIITLFELGVAPVVVPRRSNRGEHVDDHQTQIAELLADRRLAVVVEAPELTADALHRARDQKVEAVRYEAKH